MEAPRLPRGGLSGDRRASRAPAPAPSRLLTPSPTARPQRGASRAGHLQPPPSLPTHFLASQLQGDRSQPTALGFVYLFV